jgi:colanic acid biosynthesis glycosyl transferase WcaI
MRILLYGINFNPELNGIGKYTGEMATWLSARGHQVRVITAPPYYPDWKVRSGFRNWWTKSHEAIAAGGPLPLNSLKIYRCPLWVPAHPGGLKRLLHLASFALSSLPVMLRMVMWRPDVVWVVEPALFCAPAAAAVARLSGARAWLHVQDFEVDAAFDLGLLRSKFLRALVTGAERWMMRRFDVVSTISKRMHQRLLAKGVPLANTVMAVNWVDLAAFSLSTSAGVAAYRQELAIPDDAAVALYSGNMGAKQGLELLAEVAKLIAADEQASIAASRPLRNTDSRTVVFVFCGNGVGRANLEERCRGLNNVRFIDLQPAERLPDLLALADVHLLPQRADAADLVMPSKLTGMLASARPVVATAESGTELADVIAGGAAHCGLVVAPGDASAFAAAVQALAADPVRCEQFGAAGYLYAQAHLDRDAVLKRFEADLLALLQRDSEKK